MGSGTTAANGRMVVHGNGSRGLLQPIDSNFAVGCAGATHGEGIERGSGEAVGLQNAGNSPPPDRPLIGISTHGAEACTTEGQPATAVSGGVGAGAGMSADAMDSLQAAAELAALFSSQQPSPPRATAVSPKHQQAPPPGLSGGLPGMARSLAMSNDAPPAFLRPVPAPHMMRPMMRPMMRRPAPVRPATMRVQPKLASPPTVPQQGGDDEPAQQLAATGEDDKDEGEEEADEPAPPPWEYVAEEDETPRQIAADLGISVKELVSANKERYPRLHQHAKLMEGTVLEVSGTVPKPPPRQPRKRVAPKPTAAPKPKKLAAAKPKAQRETPRPVATGEHAPEVATAIGSVKLRDDVWVKWVDGDGEFYKAEVTNVSKTRGVTVRYPETDEWAAWTEVLAISDITSDRVRFKPAPRRRGKHDRASSEPSPEKDDKTDVESAAASRGAPSSWSEEEDKKLLSLIAEHGEGDWGIRAHDLGTNRTAKACQTRYRNHLRYRSEYHVSGKRKLAAESNGPVGNKKVRINLIENDAPRRSSRAAALKQVTYNDDDAFQALEAELESPAVAAAAAAAAAPGSRGKGRPGRAARPRDDEGTENDEGTADDVGAEASESDSDSSDSESTQKPTSKRRGGDEPMSEAELERLRRQQLRWLRLQEQREAAEAAKREEQEREREREETRRKAKEAKEQRKQAEAARRAKREAERLKQQAAIERAVAEDEEKLALVAEGAVDAPANDESAKKAEQRLRAKQRGLMRLMKQLHVDAQAGLVAPERNGSSKVRTSAPVSKFCPEKEEERPQWSSSKLARVQSNESGSGSDSDTEGGDDPDEDSDGQHKPGTKGVVARGDKEAAREASPKSPDADMTSDTSVAGETPSEIASCGDDYAWDPLLGRALEKSFEGHGIFRGTVTSYEDKSSPRVYTVRYDDGDEEDLEEHELTPLLLEAKCGKHEDARLRNDGSKRSSPGDSSDRRWDEYLVGSAIQYRLPFASGRGSNSEKAWMWLRGIVKRTCKSHADWVHVAFDNSSSFDVQVLPASRGTVWCIEPQR